MSRDVRANPLHDALVRVIKRRKTDEGKVEAVLKLLGLEKDDVIVNRDDLHHVLSYSADAEIALDDYGDAGPPGWDEDAIEVMDDAWFRLSDIAGIKWEDA